MPEAGIDDIWLCDCGSEVFVIRRDGKIECAFCEEIADELVVVESQSASEH